MNPQLLALAVQELPQAILVLKTLFHHASPDDPIPTDAEVIAAYQQAITDSLAKDAAWLASHPAP